MGVTELGKEKPKEKEKSDHELTDKEVLAKLFPPEALEMLKAPLPPAPKKKPK